MLRTAVALVTLLVAGAAEARNYGSIAYNARSGASGHSYDFAQKWQAEERALQECGPGCRTAISFWNSCGAVAAGGRGGWGSGLGNSRAEAERAALRSCLNHGNSNCRPVVWTCTTR